MKRSAPHSGKELAKDNMLSADSDAHTPSPKIDLRDARAIRRELATVYREVRSGKLAAADGTKLAHILEVMRRMYETGELEGRIELVERQLQTRRH